jgi:CheY-like chemotaxis protein
VSMKIRVLVVEDDQATLRQWEMEVDVRNAEAKDTGKNYELKTATSAADAQILLDNFDFDVAVVDINLKSPSGVAANRDGNIVLDSVLNSELAVVAVFSGEPIGSAEPPAWAKNVHVFAKGNGGMKTVMAWLEQQLPMIAQIKLAERQIKREMVKLFTRSIWPRWNQWVTEGIVTAEENFVSEALTRHLTAHMYGIFLEKSKHKVHPEEWYFIPSIREGLRTGDLIRRKDGVVEILVTPRCDLAREGKNESFQLAECRDVSTEWNAAAEKVRAADVENAVNTSTDAEIIAKLKKNVGDAKSKLRQFSQHKGNSSVFHFLPRLSLDDRASLGPFMINFDKIRSVPRNNKELVAQLEGGKFAAITPEFLPSVIERLGSYFSRFGNPDYSHPE